MPLAPDFYTAEMVRALPEDGKRYEVVHGELAVTPSPRWGHQAVVPPLIAALVGYCQRYGVGRVMSAPADISWSPDTLVQPDVFVIAPQEANVGEWSAVRSLSLVAEVLSPSTAGFDRFQKRRLYQAQGVAAIWLIDVDRRTVEVWTPAALVPTIETERIAWLPAGALEPLIIEFSALFA